MPDLIDHLRGLVQSDGWQAVKRHAETQWSDSYVLSRMKSELGRIPSGDELSQQETARNILSAQEAVLQMLAWPEAEIKRLSLQQQPTEHLSIVDRFKRQVGR